MEQRPRKGRAKQARGQREKQESNKCEQRKSKKPNSLSFGEGLRELSREAFAGPPGTENAAASGPREHRFSPYQWNAGTVVAVAGEDYCIVAGDTRLADADSYSILSRNCTRLHHLSPTTFLAAGGCFADTTALFRNLGYRTAMYKHKHGCEMSTIAAAQMLSPLSVPVRSLDVLTQLVCWAGNALYGKRFFPYYALCVIGGLDEEGKGYTAGYDAIGSYIRARNGYSVSGSGEKLAITILDNLLGHIGVGNATGQPQPKRKHTSAEMVEIIKDIFITVGERDVNCGDGVEIVTITKDGVAKEVFELKKD